MVEFLRPLKPISLKVNPQCLSIKYCIHPWKEILSPSSACHGQRSTPRTFYISPSRMHMQERTAPPCTVNTMGRTRWYSRVLNDYESRGILGTPRFVSGRRCSPRRSCPCPFKRHPTLQPLLDRLTERLESHKAPRGDRAARQPAFCSSRSCIHVFHVGRVGLNDTSIWLSSYVSALWFSF